MPLQSILISNPQITLKRDKNGKTYFLILDQDTNLVYYAFPNFIKKGEHELTISFFKVPKTIWIKFEEGFGSFKSRKVVEFSRTTVKT